MILVLFLAMTTALAQTPHSDRYLMPAPEQRDRIFNEVPELNYFISPWSQEARNDLFMRSRIYSVSQLKEMYPQLSEEQLTALERAVTNFDLTKPKSVPSSSRASP